MSNVELARGANCHLCVLRVLFGLKWIAFAFYLFRARSPGIKTLEDQGVIHNELVASQPPSTFKAWVASRFLNNRFTSFWDRMKAAFVKASDSVAVGATTLA